jgi:AcrR family transcriptional regulator
MSEPRRRGRPRAGEQAQRRQEALDAALAELVERGLEQTTMQAVAARTGSSKESLYAWFGSRDGLLGALIERQAAEVGAALAKVTAGGDARATLTRIAENLLRLLLGEASVALNRAAMPSADLADLLLRHGRHTTGPLVEAYLATLGVADPPEAFQLFYGLVVRDLQIRRLLGEAVEVDARADAERAVERFLRLVGPTPG